MAEVIAAAVAAAAVEVRERVADDLVERAHHLAQGPEHLVDMTLLDDERRRDRDDVARVAQQKAPIVAFEEDGTGAVRRHASAGPALDGGADAAVAPGATVVVANRRYK